ncbi:DUF2270 domain-containing protein [Haladaptatus sp. DJG-WS-42]|uniref:DUF2270 domain-containing protein n=1 Tax=Haladaptatus sp. DJG-WS-42 TaxID=3120516 RepID=UPI0030D5EF98
MTSSDDHFDPEAREGREVAGEAATDRSDFLALMGHVYRGEVGRANAWRTRLDRTTNWAVVLTATLLTWAFSADTRPHYVILVGMVMVALFLVFEARRYRIYDVWRSRVRLLEENVFANALDPEGAEQRGWRKLLSHDLRTPTVKTPLAEALARRSRRIYFPLFIVLLLAWIIHLAVFDATDAGLLQRASIGRLPGVAVSGAVSLFYATIAGITFWPRERHAKGELQSNEQAQDDWKA